MSPVNQIILGNDAIFSNIDEIDSQIKKMEMYKQKLSQLKEVKSTLWNNIDLEISSMNIDQRNKLFEDSEYLETYNEIQNMVQTELLNLVKGKIENSEKGKTLLEKQLKILKKLKDNIIKESNKEIELFNKFKEFSKTNPNATYEEFIKSQL